MLEVGSRVRINPLYWDDNVPWLCIFGVGTIKEKDQFVIIVDWDSCGPDYAYPVEDSYLIPADESTQDCGFRVGDRVCAIMHRIRGGGKGTIIGLDGTPLFKIRIKFDHSNNIEDWQPPSVQHAQDELVVGARVRFNHTHENYRQYFSQHRNTNGTIIDIYSDDLINDNFPYKVNWNCGGSNVYKKDMLIPIQEQETNPFDTINVTPELYLPGTQIRLKETYGQEFFGNNDTYIVDICLDEKDLKNWKQQGSEYVTVCIGGQKSIHILKTKYGNIIPIDAPPVKVDYFVIANFGEYCVINDDKDMWSEIDALIINNKEKLLKHITYNDAWRQNILENQI